MPPCHTSHRSPLLGLERHAIQFADHVLCFGEKEELDTLCDTTLLDPLALSQTLERVQSGQTVFLRPTSTSSFRPWLILIPAWIDLSEGQWEALQVDQTEDWFAISEWQRRGDALPGGSAAFATYYAVKAYEIGNRLLRRQRECLILFGLHKARKASLLAAAAAASVPSSLPSPRLIWMKKVERFDLNTVEGIDAKGYCAAEYRIAVGTAPGEGALPFLAEDLAGRLASGKLVFPYPPPLPNYDKNSDLIRDWPALLSPSSSISLFKALESGKPVIWRNELDSLFSSVSQKKWEEVNLAAWEDFLGYHGLMRRDRGGKEDGWDRGTARCLAERFHLRYQECLVLHGAYSLLRDSLPPDLAEKPALPSVGSEKTIPPSFDLESAFPSGFNSLPSLVDKLHKQAGCPPPHHRCRRPHRRLLRKGICTAPAGASAQGAARPASYRPVLAAFPFRLARRE